MSAAAVERCETCGTSLSLNGTCPVCLIALGLELPVEPGSRPVPPRVGIPDQVGPYRIRGLLGEGTTGVVYLAEQEEPVRRQVALKLITPGTESDQVLARIESGRQALARVGHPNVAKVFDAGRCEDGRPYVVTEFVQGVTITAHCDQQTLSIRGRLDLFVQACEAVQHAHQEGLVHGGIKASNVLVRLGSQRPAVRVVDFGMAKATAVDRATQADIHALGTVLYELLGGAPPFDPAGPRGSARRGSHRTLRQPNAQGLSARLLGLGEAAGEVARRRMTDVPTLIRLLSGELEWITLKTLEEDPAYGYLSVSELEADLHRYMNCEAVLARPRTLWSRIRRFARDTM